MLAASVGLSACDTEEQEAVSSPMPQLEQSACVLHFSASQEGSLQKTAFSGSRAYFLEADTMGVFSNGALSPFVVEQLFNGAYEALFAGKAEKADEYYALYPYSAATKIEGNVISAKLPSVQKAYQNDFDPDAAIMAGYCTSDDMGFAMKNATSMIYIYSNSPFSKVTIETLDKTPIAGDFSIAMDKDGIPQISGGTENSITAEAVDGIATRAYINVLPASIKAGNLKITIVRKDGSVREEVLDKDVELKRSVYNTFYPYFTVKIDQSAAGLDDREIKVAEGDYYSSYDNFDYVDGKEWGYSTKKDGDIEYFMGDRFTPTANTDLYLVCQDYKYAITIDANGGKFEDGSSAKPFKHATNSWCDPRNYERPIRDGYVFDYYSSDKEGKNSFYDYIGKDTTVYAQWTKQYTFKLLDCNGLVLRSETFTKNTYSILTGYRWDYDFGQKPGQIFLGFKDQDGNDFDLDGYMYPRRLDEIKDIVLTPVYADPNASHEGWEARPF